MFHTKVLSEVDHAKTRDKICALAPAAFEPGPVHTDVLKVMLMDTTQEGGSQEGVRRAGVLRSVASRGL